MNIIIKKPLATKGEEKVVVALGEYFLLPIIMQQKNSDYERELFFFISEDPNLKGVCIEKNMLRVMIIVGFIEIKNNKVRMEK